MRYTRLNKNWSAELSSPTPTISETSEGVEFTFQLNPSLYEHIDAGEEGKLEFFNVHAYRIGMPIDEGFFRGQLKLMEDPMSSGEFYELKESKWGLIFPDDTVFLNELTNKKEIRHFLFFIGDDVFECLATGYKFTYDNKLTELLDEKYPKGYLNHYLSIFNSHFNKPSVDNFNVYTDLYIQMEGESEFTDLKKELKNIKKNKDLNLYLKYANSFDIENFGGKQLNDMIGVIEKYKV